MRPKVSDMDDLSRNCPRQSWRWGELPSPPVSSNRTSPPKTVTGSASRDVSPADRADETGAINRAINEAPTGIENGSRQSQTTAEGTK